MKNHLLTVCLAALCLLAPLAAGDLATQEGSVWITIGNEKLGTLTETLSKRGWNAKTHLFKTDGDVAVALIPSRHVMELSQAIHHEHKRCGGYIVHETREAALKALDNPKIERGMNMMFADYSIDNPAVVQALLEDLQETKIEDTIIHLSDYHTRYYTTQTSVDAMNWLKELWESYANGRADVTVEFYSHSWQQPSLIFTLEGSDLPNEVVVVGGHADSIAGFGGSGRAPGADDDASGIATISEIIRTAMVNDFKPRRTIKFMAYAAEEVGLRGSGAIASSFSSNNTNVVGVMQLDMTAYKGSQNDIVLMTDYTNTALNNFVSSLIDTYVGVPWGTDACGYACSDHASWTNNGFPASMPFEAQMGDHNSRIHTANDTLANAGGDASHAFKFAKMGAAFIAELGKGDLSGPGDPPGGDDPVTENFSGSLARSEMDHYGPFQVKAGTEFRAQITGTGDADLYVRFGGAPTTSSYDCRPYLNGSSETCTQNVPNGVTEAYVMVRGYTSATYDLAVTYTKGDGGGGDPPGGDEPVTENFDNNSVARGVNDNYGPFNVVPGTEFSAVIAPTGSDNGDADIYVRFGAAPTTGSYDCRPYRNGSNETCTDTVPSGVTQAYVMVRGYTAAVYDLTVSYTRPGN
ncbi:M20/M25/M40 family metallo-hydrolase [Sulfidibacter corallicola]|uniref:M20/M25/M40 family metallo-hydrolase n=1 Tax=Sulfidibacter corallicola TaxID=2818388 RepID=A0A8A4TKX4_SULCO|nr:M20/M25/M40 family metallo-hydrolase [Sulfidibacter corallicola]QTD49498.1 M20/M25/M40 family metallo-hydrolase [Sulfidibacter corallicola]